MRTRWIAPVADDPDYENLYDRFYGLMSDAAIVEQLAFAALLTGRGDLAERARRRLVGLARAWAPERSVTPDYGTAYAVSRLFKGLAVGWDLVGSGLAAAERRLVRTAILDLVGGYWDGWYSPADQRRSLGAHPPRASRVGVTRRRCPGDARRDRRCPSLAGRRDREVPARPPAARARR